MVSYGGYCGRLLRVDLTTKKISTEALTDDFIRKYVGCNGFGAAILFKELPARIDPFSPANKVVLATGPLTGTIVPCTPKVGVFTKSPLTEGFMDSYAGGHFGAELKFAAFDGVIIEGASESPVWLYIHDGQAELRDASKLWGLSVPETEAAVRGELNNNAVHVASIGPAGERLVRFGCVMVDMSHAAGRGGAGAVLGSKKLKAIVVHGTKYSVPVANVEATKAVTDRIYQHISETPALRDGMPKYGTTGALKANQASGILGTRNWQSETFEHASNIDGDACLKELFEKNLACFQCPLRCVHFSRIKEGKYAGTETIGPQYETMYSLGSVCGIADIKAVAKANEYCNAMGMDTISAGVTVAFAMELYERGILTAEDLGGIQLTFGNDEALLAALERVVARSGVYRTLGEGTKRAAEILGGEAYKYAIQVKGLELAGHSGRGYKGMSLGYATSPRGGSHQDMRHLPERAGLFDRRDPNGKAQLNYDITSTTTIRDTFNYCAMIEDVIGRVGLSERHAELLNAVTGLNFSVQDVQRLADRIWNLERAFNVREGMSRKDDVLPYRFMNEPIPERPSQGMYCPPEELERMKDELYKLRRWTPEGIPSKELLLDLGLDDVAAELWP